MKKTRKKNWNCNDKLRSCEQHVENCEDVFIQLTNLTAKKCYKLANFWTKFMLHFFQCSSQKLALLSPCFKRYFRICLLLLSPTLLWILTQRRATGCWAGCGKAAKWLPDDRLNPLARRIHKVHLRSQYSGPPINEFIFFSFRPSFFPSGNCISIIKEGRALKVRCGAAWGPYINSKSRRRRCVL